MFPELTTLARAATVLAGSLALTAPGGGALCGAQVPAGPHDEGLAALVRTPERQPIDLALCLDTSGSMDGLIESAKERLWTLVNDLALAEPLPDLRVALLTYGNDGHAAEDGWVRLDVPLTRDLDTVSEQLFALTTNGGTELVGRVVGVAHGRLDWSPRADALKLIVVAGNESADQDRKVPYADAARAAIADGVQIDAIYCGDPAAGDADSWRHVAGLADGRFASIESDGGTVAVATPYDARLGELSVALNGTYLPFGEGGAWGLSNQARQDANVVTLNSNAVADRAVSKASALYRCDWDLVDAVANEQVVLAEVDEQELPEELAALPAEQRQARLDEIAEQRAELQQQIQALDAERQAWLTVERARLALDGSRALDDVLCDAVREQARAKGFRFTGPAGHAEPGAPGAQAPEAGPLAAPAQVSQALEPADC